MPTFRAKARAIDLLGKGQIADLPTAICELWKNGYDAYADNLSCDLYLKGYEGIKSPIFTLSDDGTGMSKEDIEDKWIVLGTDSRVRGVQAVSDEERLSKEPRTPMGEKGIGRLSVAYLGPVMFMLTKKKNEKCQVLFIDWRILENYNLYLDDVNIPLKEISSIQNASKIFQDSIDEFKLNFKRGNWHEHNDVVQKVIDDLGNIAIPDLLLEKILVNLLSKTGHGTIFIIIEPHELLLELARGEKIDIPQTDAIKYLRSSLSGINNSFNDEKLFETSFWVHDSSGKYDLISKQNFFNKEDVLNADHWLEGSFDENGFFTGELQVFNTILIHTYRPIRPPGSTPYGPFKIRFGFIEGDAKNSKLPREKWDIIFNKCDQFGGLYIYRDKFRVLPYGRIDFDFLKFEERRSLSATYYQFSHRRLFGYIEINREINSSLKDKAGREGFIENKAYREFKEDLISFFIDLSKRYFRTITPDEKEKGEALTIREQQVESIRQHNERILKAEKNRNKMTAKRFKEELNINFIIIDEIKIHLNQLYDKLRIEKEKATIIYNDLSLILTQIEDEKIKLRKMKLVKPRRASLTTSLINKYGEYRDKYDDTKQLIDNNDTLISEVQKILTRENLEEEYNKRHADLLNSVTSLIKEYDDRFLEAVDRLEKQILEDIQKYPDVYAEKTSHLTLSGNEKKDEIEIRIKALEQIREAIVDDLEEKYEPFISHVEGLSFDIDDDLLLDWYKEQYEKIEEKIDAIHELAQLGMAIEIIDHQFNVLYSEMSSAIEFFKKLSDTKPEIEYNYRQLRNSFEHLETNHQLLTPLYRTMRRSKINIKGSEMKAYLNKFFEKRFERHRIEFTTDPSFDDYTFYTYESVIKPVFINIVNNALYWLIPSSERKIHITYENDKILIMNSGVKIDEADMDKLFTLFFTRKPGGRGIGLYLAKTNLHKIGYNIYVSNDKKLNKMNGACFVIEQLNGVEKKNEL